MALLSIKKEQTFNMEVQVYKAVNATLKDCIRKYKNICYKI